MHFINLLLTKIYRPKIQDNLVNRQELTDALDRSKNKKLVLVSAPPGYGKTSLIAQWINKRKHAATWYSLDNSDNDPSQFLTCIIAGIQTYKDDFGLSSLKLLDDSNQVNLESILALFINDLLRMEEQLFIVLDDFHVITNKEIFTIIKYLLNHTPNHVQLVILTRSDPPFATSRLRSQGEIMEIRISDLGFKAHEIAKYFSTKHKIKLSASDVDSLEKKTEGWVAGLQLVALSMQLSSNRSDFVEELAGSNRYIMDYLIEEVIQNQSHNLQEFLLYTSVLTRMSAPLCDKILNRSDSQMILEQLDRDNMFIISLDGERKWYRYHHLFADLLKQRFQQKGREAVESLHQKACNWFEENDMYDTAIEHALEIKDYERCVLLIGKTVESMWRHGKHAAISRYCDVIPDEVIKANAELSLYYGWILIVKGKVERATQFLESAKKSVKNPDHKNKQQDSNKSEAYRKQLFSKVSIAFAYLYSLEENTEKVLAYCQIGLVNLNKNDWLWHSWAWYTYGLAYFSQGNLKESQKSFNTAFSFAQSTGNIYLQSTILIHLAEAEQQLGFFQTAYDRCTNLLSNMNELGYGDLAKIDWTYAPLYQIMGVTELGWAEFDKAYEHIKIAYQLSKKGNDNFFKIYVSVIYSVILNYLGDKEGESVALELDKLMRQSTVPPFLESFYITSKVYWFLDKKQFEQAQSFLVGYGLDVNQEIDHAFEMAYIAYARVLIYQQKLDEAEVLLNRLNLFANENNEVDRKIELSICFTQLYELKGQKEKAIESLMGAMELSVDQNHMFDLVFWASKLKNILKEVYRIQATKTTRIPRMFIEKLRLTIENEAKRKKNKIQSDLTPRELETLILLAEDISNQALADKLFISLNTVKTRLKNIFLKLEVDNRRKAVTKAKSLGLI